LLVLLCEFEVPVMTQSPTAAQLVAHLYRRAGFGALPSELSSATSAGYAETVRALLSGLDAPDPGGDAVTAPVLGSPPSLLGGRSRGTSAEKALSVQLHQEFYELSTWWLSRMLATSTPLKEKLTFLLHGLFPTAVSKVRFPLYMYGQNQLFRTQGNGDFDKLTQAVARDPAMMIWLDADSNKASNPNENFARELMERFTMGIGTYTQADVRAAAYCFTGWRLNRATGTVSIDAADHLDAPQTFLGNAGINTGQQVIDIVTHSEASSRYVPSRFWSYLAYPVAPHNPVVSELAPGYAADRNVGNLLSAIFNHPEFISSQARNGLVKQPVEYVVGALRAVGVTPSDLQARPGQLLPVLAGLGQVPFDPPSVGGWPQNGYWLSTAAALTRWEFAHRLARTGDISMVADAARSERVDAAAQMLSVDGWGTTTAAALHRVTSDPPTLVTLALASPEYASN
jgi:uncharacterized protein (DUF1800 family)